MAPLNPNLVDSDIILAEASSQTYKQAIMTSVLQLLYKLKLMGSVMVWHLDVWASHRS